MAVKIYKQINPELFDIAIGEIQDVLGGKIPWLSNIYGKVQKLVRLKENKEVYYPGVYVKKKDYISVLPDVKNGNIAFFVLADPQGVDFTQNLLGNVSAPFSIVFWFNQKTIDGNDSRNTEMVKAQILKALTTSHIKSGRFEVTKIYERAENIFQGFTLKEIETQYLMQPYAGLRFEGVITVRQSC